MKMAFPWLIDITYCAYLLYYIIFLAFSVGLNSIYLASIILVCASRAGVEPKIKITKGTMPHSKTIKILLNPLTPLGLGGKIVLLKIIQVKLVKRVNLKSRPVILGKL